MRGRGQAELILRVLVYAIFIYALILIVQMVLGRRTTVTDLLVVIVVGLLLELLRIENKLGKLEGKVKSLSKEIG